MGNCNLSETGCNKIKLLFSILASSDIIRYIQELTRDIQTHSEVCVTLVYSEPWYIQNPGIFRSLAYSGASHLQNPGILGWQLLARSKMRSVSGGQITPALHHTNFRVAYFSRWIYF